MVHRKSFHVPLLYIIMLHIINTNHYLHNMVINPYSPANSYI